MKNKFITQKIEEIEEYLPNTDKYKIRLDANESPYMPSQAVMDEFQKAISSIEFNRYPDPYATELVKAFSRVYQIDPSNIIAGNGSDELISLICSGFTEPGDIVNVTVPDFSMYEFYSTYSGAVVNHYVKNENYDIDFDELADIVKQKRSKIVVFSNPCNPTGKLYKRKSIEEFIRKVDSLIIVDEAYMEFSKSDESLLKNVNDYENLIVLKTLSKAFGSAALRIGFAISNCELINAIRKIKSPYNINSVSQTFGRIVLENYSDIEKNINSIKKNTSHLYQELKKIENSSILKINETSANFVYIKVSTGDEAKRIAAYLKSKGIVVRCMAADSCLRITAGIKDEIDKTISGIKEAVL